MEISVSSKGQYDSIKTILLVLIAFFMGPSIYGALMSAINDGDITKYLMLLGLLIVGIVLVLIYRYICIGEVAVDNTNTGNSGTDVKLAEVKPEVKPAEVKPEVKSEIKVEDKSSDKPMIK